MDEQLKDMNLDDSLTEELGAGEAETGTAGGAEEGTAVESGRVAGEVWNGEGHAEKGPSGVGGGVHVEVMTPHQKRSMQERELSLLLRSRGRSLSMALMTVAGTRQRSGRFWLISGATLLVIGLLVCQVFYRHRELNLGYDLSEAISEREVLLEENRKLRIELRVLSRRERLEPLAGKQLGMSTIRPEQVLIVHERARGGESAEPGRRLDGLDRVRRLGEDGE